MEDWGAADLLGAMGMDESTGDRPDVDGASPREDRRGGAESLLREEKPLARADHRDGAEVRADTGVVTKDDRSATDASTPVGAATTNSEQTAISPEVALDLIRRSTLDQLASTTSAVGPLRRAPAAGEIYRIPIAGEIRLVAASDLQTIFQAALARSRLSSNAVERRQDWSRYDLGSAPLSEVDPDRLRAVAANSDLRLHGRVVEALWERLLPTAHSHRFFTRALTDALMDHGAVRGLVSLEVLRSLDIGALLVDGSSRRREEPLLARLTADQLSALATTLGIPAGDLTRSEQRRRNGSSVGRVFSSGGFGAALASWQAWERRTTVPTGELHTADLQMLGGGPGAESAEEPARPNGDAGQPAEQATVSETGLTEVQRAEVADCYRVLNEVLARSTDRASVPLIDDEGQRLSRSERRSMERQLRAEQRRRVELELTRALQGDVLPRMERGGIGEWSPAQMTRGRDPVESWARRVNRSLARLLGQEPSAPEDASATEELGDYVTGAGTLRRTGWDHRLSHGGRSPEAQAPDVLRQLAAYRSLVSTLHGQVLAALAQIPAAGTRDQLETARPAMERALSAIAGHLGSRSAAEIRLNPPPVLIRHQISARFPERPELHQSASGLRGQLRSWGRVLGGLLGSARNISIESAENVTEQYGHSIVNVNHSAVYVDLHRSGVEVTNNQGNALVPIRSRAPSAENSDGTNVIHLDPPFALAMVHFLEAIAGLGVTRMWTSGFLRDAMSPADTHPMGMACDITGFTFSDGTVIHLRSGYPRRARQARQARGEGRRTAEAAAPQAVPGGDDAPSDSQVEPDALDTGSGHSDWFDFEHTFAGRPHAHVMMGIAAMLPSYFHRIIGPGHNEKHMGHFHVELSPGGPRSDGLRLHAVSSESTHLPDWTRDGANRGNPGWDGEIEPIPLLEHEPAAEDAGDAPEE